MVCCFVLVGGGLIRVRCAGTRAPLFQLSARLLFTGPSAPLSGPRMSRPPAAAAASPHHPPSAASAVVAPRNRKPFAVRTNTMPEPAPVAVPLREYSTNAPPPPHQAGKSNSAKPEPPAEQRAADGVVAQHNHHDVESGHDGGNHHQDHSHSHGLFGHSHGHDEDDHGLIDALQSGSACRAALKPLCARCSSGPPILQVTRARASLSSASSQMYSSRSARVSRDGS
jgi:hypothetical protein